MKKKNPIYILLLCIFGAVFLFSGVMLGTYLFQGQTQENRYEELSQLLPAVERPPVGQPQPEESLSDTVTVEGRQILPRFLQLYQLNHDIIGWLEIPGTKVNYPVMQTPDQTEYYLARNFDKKSSSRGCLFVQGEADVFAPSDNLTIYGHHMKDGTMFGQLDKYRKESFFLEHRYIYFDTLEATHTYEILAVFKTSGSPDKGFAYHTFVDADDEEAFAAYVARCKALSFYDTGVEAAYGDKLITLSTCEYSLSNGRLVVVAKLVA